MVVVPSGAFTMGSPDEEKDRDKDEGPRHVVTISRPFAAGKLQVTVDQFAAFVRERGMRRVRNAILPKAANGRNVRGAPGAIRVLRRRGRIL
jgi:formylglycine-generating enzyme required for sulfatase activity